MPTAVVMPRLGNSVESSIIVSWKKRVGDLVNAGESLLEVETDKASIEVEAPASGTLLALFYEAGADVPVMTPIAAIGQAGEDYSAIAGDRGEETAVSGQVSEVSPQVSAVSGQPSALGTQYSVLSTEHPTADTQPPIANTLSPVSPRARKLAERTGVDTAAMSGTGPGGRIIERDVQAALAQQPKLTPVAQRMVAQGGYAVPQDAAPGKKITTRDLVGADDKEGAQYIAPLPAAASQPPTPTTPPHSEATITPLRGIRKTIATRMLASLQTTAQLTMNMYADARAIRSYRDRLKNSDQALGLHGITINDLVMYAAVRTLLTFPSLNAHLKDDAIHEFSHINLGFAVDTSRGLIVPVIHRADTLSPRTLSQQAFHLARAAHEGKIKPEELEGGTFTVTNLGGMGVDTFTPVLNPPQVAILGVGGISLRPLEVDGTVQFVPHMALSLTIDHRAVDGAPGARFLQALARLMSQIDVLAAI